MYHRTQNRLLFTAVKKMFKKIKLKSDLKKPRL